jgi:hypothetical protein
MELLPIDAGVSAADPSVDSGRRSIICAMTGPEPATGVSF